MHRIQGSVAAQQLGTMMISLPSPRQAAESVADKVPIDFFGEKADDGMASALLVGDRIVESPMTIVRRSVRHAQCGQGISSIQGILFPDQDGRVDVLPLKR